MIVQLKINSLRNKFDLLLQILDNNLEILLNDH